MIKVRDLHFSYANSNTECIKGINFEINKGEIFGFLGPSGAGKSTTQKVLIGILKNYSGIAEVNGYTLSKVNNKYFENIGVVFELPNVYTKFTALENLEYFRNLYSVETLDPMELLNLVGLGEDANTRVSSFSKGMKMRLNFCRGLLNNADIIFLDEPTSGLDPVNARRVKDIILEKRDEGKTIFLTTHNMNDADELCNRVAFLVDGRIELMDSPYNLKVKYGKKIVRIDFFEEGHIHSFDFDLDGIGFNELFCEYLRTKDIRRIHSQEASLEDIFIKTTGRELI